MSTPSTPNGRNTIVVGIVAVVLFTLAAVVAIAIAVPEGANPGSLITILLASMPATIGAIVAVGKTGVIDEKVDDLGNGLMDSKLRAAVADVVRPEHLRDEMSEQLAVDRARRAAGHRRRRNNGAPDVLINPEPGDIA